MAEEEVKEAAAEAKEAPAADGAAAAKPASGKLGMLVVIIVGFLVMAITPLVTYFAVKATLPPPVEKKQEEKKEGERPILDLKPVNVNIAETKGTRILRVEAHLVLSEAKLMEELKNSTSMLVDRIILAASRKTLDELDGPEGHEALKRDIMSEINAAIKEKMTGSVIDVYFSEFIVQ
jgi:flagellar basal body-associated protein FliL